MDATFALAAGIAVTAAVRSTWSPCGVSMLSTITPITEASRRRRYGVTVAWFVAGAVLGGACLGALTAGLAVVASAIGLSSTATLTGAAVLALAGAAFDARVGGLQLPGHGRQVNESWLTRYRSWVYGGAFGWQIGVGLTTYIVTAAVYLTILLAALTASPAAAFGIGVLFGLVRGLAIFAGTPLRSIERLHTFHRAFEERRELSRLVTIGLQLIVAAIAAGLAGGPLAAAVVALAGVGVVVARRPDVMRVRPTALGVTTPVELTGRPTPADQVIDATTDRAGEPVPTLG